MPLDRLNFLNELCALGDPGMGEPEYEDRMEYAMRTPRKGSAREMPVSNCSLGQKRNMLDSRSKAFAYHSAMSIQRTRVRPAHGVHEDEEDVEDCEQNAAHMAQRRGRLESRRIIAHGVRPAIDRYNKRGSA